MGTEGKIASTSFRLPDLTKNQIEELGKKWGMTQTKVLIVCVDRIANSELETPNEIANGGKPVD